MGQCHQTRFVSGSTARLGYKQKEKVETLKLIKLVQTTYLLCEWVKPVSDIIARGVSN